MAAVGVCDHFVSRFMCIVSVSPVECDGDLVSGGLLLRCFGHGAHAPERPMIGVSGLVILHSPRSVGRLTQVAPLLADSANTATRSCLPLDRLPDSQ